mgnify:CR=1 FL=1
MTPLLNITSLRKSFGGVAATDGVNLGVEQGELHAIIGPNGAGKTTLISQLCGALRPDSGAITFKGADITNRPAYVRARLGITRSFQITSLVMDMSVLDNVALAVQARTGHSFRFLKPARSIQPLRDEARNMLARVGLAERADDPTVALSHGEHRQMEIAIALATGAELMLLDEPMAGLGPEESTTMIAFLKALKGDRTILLIEHDMDAVFALADRISVLVYGRIIATGTPDEIRNNDDVRHAYLGEE